MSAFEKIRISLAGERKTYEVEGWRIPGQQFAAHDWPGWTITHIPSGKRVTCVPNKREALKVLREIKRIKLPLPLLEPGPRALTEIRERYMQRWDGR